MLPKKNRAGSKTLEKVFKEGEFADSQLFTLKFVLKNSRRLPKLSFIVPKSIGKLSSERNRLRRLGYKALKKYLPDLPRGSSGAFIYKKSVKTLEEVDSGLWPIIKSLKK